MATRRLAYTAIVENSGWTLGIAEEGFPGYSPMKGTYPDEASARKSAKELNDKLGLTERDALGIIASSFRAQNTRGLR